MITSIYPFRLDARAKNSAEWNTVDFAWTQLQADRKVIDFLKHKDDVEGASIVVEIQPSDYQRPTAALQEMRPEPRSDDAIARIETDDDADKNPPIDAMSGVTPLPFSEGEKLRDIHTGNVVTVTKIHAADGSGRAFDWACEAASADATGTCPLASVGCFEKIPEEKPAAVITPEVHADKTVKSPADDETKEKPHVPTKTVAHKKPAKIRAKKTPHHPAAHHPTGHKAKK
jgi:hypothetical protein